MKERLKNSKTTAIGLVVLGAAIYLLATGKIEGMTFIMMTVLSWVFLAAKDSLLEGITAGLFKIEAKPPADEAEVLITRKPEQP